MEVVEELEDTPIQRMLNELAPGERREHRRAIEPSGAGGRFWRVSKDGRISNGSLRWINDRERPSGRHGNTPYRSISDIEVPVFDFPTECGPIVGDFYALGTSVFAFGEPLVDAINQLDPDAIETRQAKMKSPPDGRRFFLGIIVRWLDVIDLDRTNVSLWKKRIAMSDRYSARATYPNGFTIRADVSPSLHCFCELFSGAVLFSDELVTVAEAMGVSGLYCSRPGGQGVAPKELWRD